MSFTAFKMSARGQVIAPLMRSEQVLAAMEELSRSGKPAVAAIDALLAGRIALNNTEKQHVGRWIRDVLAPRGWRTTEQRRVSGGRLFSSGMVYERPAAVRETAPVELQSFAQRVHHARERVRALSTNDYGVDDFLQDKRAEAAAEAAR